MNSFKEREYKFKADAVSLLEFQKLMNSLKPKDVTEIGSYDSYYTNDDEFIRFRDCKIKPELTVKRKTTEINNFNRIEINLPLGQTSEATVESFVKLLGYEKNFKIYKYCWIYFFEKVDIVYYIVHNEEMKEMNRFIEIEYLENINDASDEAVFAVLKEYEQKLVALGIGPLNRMKRSLFERYKRDKI